MKLKDVIASQLEKVSAVEYDFFRRPDFKAAHSRFEVKILAPDQFDPNPCAFVAIFEDGNILPLTEVSPYDLARCLLALSGEGIPDQAIDSAEWQNDSFIVKGTKYSAELVFAEKHVELRVSHIDWQGNLSQLTNLKDIQVFLPHIAASLDAFFKQQEG